MTDIAEADEINNSPDKQYKATGSGIYHVGLGKYGEFLLCFRQGPFKYLNRVGKHLDKIT